MFAPRTATGLTLALLALPATATATPTDTSGGGGGGGDTASLSSHYGWGQQAPAQLTPRPYHGPGPSVVEPNPDQRSQARTSSLAGTPSPPSLASPDAADAARAGEIAKAMAHYQRSQPTTTAAKPASPDNDAPAWPELAFAGVVLLATTAGVVRVRMRRSQRLAA